MIRISFALLCLLGFAAAQEAPVAPPQSDESKEPVAKTTASGLKYWKLKDGEAGTEPEPGDKVRVHYSGWLTDGRKFDSSLDRDKPFPLMVGVGQVIAGWDEGLQLMTLGSKYKFHIPWKLAYGEDGEGTIPPKADLIFEVELLMVTKGHPVPRFREADPEKEETTKSGLKYEVIKPGDGVAGGKDQLVKIRFALWNGAGKMIMCTQASSMYISGTCGAPGLPAVLKKFNPKFFQEAVALMSKGAVVRFEVPAALCWGARKVHPDLPPNSLTVWHMEIVKIASLPKFVLTLESSLKKTASGLMYEVLQEGTGKRPTADDEVTVHYSGWTTDGKQFDSSYARDTPAVFPLSRVIAGWTEGVQLMKVGAIYRFRIPGALAYDKISRPGAPKGTLIFTIELIKIGK